MRESTLWLVVLVAGAGTFALRFSFLALFERTGGVPPRLGQALRYVPPAVFAALVVPAFVVGGEGSSTAAFTPLRLLAGVVAGVVAWRTESVLWTIVTGMVALVVLEALVGGAL